MYFQVHTPRFFTSLSPVLLGFNLEYSQRKSLYSIGQVHGDEAISTIWIDYNIVSNDPYLNYQFSAYNQNSAGYNVFKIPLSYKKELFSINSKRHPENKTLSVRLNTGMNLEFLRIKGIPIIQNPISFGQAVTLLGDTIEPVGYSGHYNRSFSMSFNLGFDFDIKNKRRFNLQLYYEQGTRKIAQAVIGIYHNDDPNFFWTSFRATSRGSSFHFNWAFRSICTRLRGRNE